VHIGREAGAALTLMDQIQVHPTGLIDIKDPKNPTKFLAPEALRGCGGILLNEKGERFVNELGLRDHVTNSIFKNCKPIFGEDGPVVTFLLLNNAVANCFDRSYLDFYLKKGLGRGFKNVRDMAVELEMPIETLENTLNKYNEASKGEAQDEFGKKVFGTSFDMSEEVFVLMVTPSIHYTMGGLSIDQNARILRSSSSLPFIGLYGAGEVTGGVHGKNRLGGNSLLECVVFGRIAAHEAASFLDILLVPDSPLPSLRSF